MEVSSQLHVPAAVTPRKNPGTHCMGSWVCPKAGLDAAAKRKHPLLVPTGNRTPVIQPVAQLL